MRLSFRLKLAMIVGVTTLALVLLTTANALIARSVESRLATIQGEYVPKVELQLQLGGAYEKLKRGFQDAVAAHDDEALSGTAELERAFLNQLDAAGAAVDPRQAEALRRALVAYYGAAYDVSRRLMAEETGEALVGAMNEMQEKQGAVVVALRMATSFDRHQLNDAFAASARAVRLGRNLQLGVSAACLSLSLLLSVWIGRGVLRSLTELAAGFRRFGSGSFAEPIPIRSKDELGAVAEQANQMASQLDRLGEESRRAEAALKLSNRELEAFSYAVAHDLRAPLRGINGFSQALLEDHAESLPPDARDHLNRIAAGAGRMGQLIDALLALSRVTRVELQREAVNLTSLADAVGKQLRSAQPDRQVELVVDDGVVANGDLPLLRALLENLLGNAWKFTSGRAGARISFGVENYEGSPTYYVRDNGAGFDMAYAGKLFAPFQRLHSVQEFAGTGIGLATVQRIVHRHGGRIWAEGFVNQGATFRFTLAPTPGGTIS